MTIDIQKIDDNAPIKMGTIVCGTRPTGMTSKNDDEVVEDTPPIGDIQSKYEDRFDDPTYYTA